MRQNFRSRFKVSQLHASEFCLTWIPTNSKAEVLRSDRPSQLNVVGRESGKKKNQGSQSDFEPQFFAVFSRSRKVELRHFGNGLFNSESAVSQLWIAAVQPELYQDVFEFPTAYKLPRVVWFPRDPRDRESLCSHCLSTSNKVTRGATYCKVAFSATTEWIFSHLNNSEVERSFFTNKRERSSLQIKSSRLVVDRARDQDISSIDLTLLISDGLWFVEREFSRNLMRGNLVLSLNKLELSLGPVQIFFRNLIERH